MALIQLCMCTGG